MKETSDKDNIKNTVNIDINHTDISIGCVAMFSSENF